MLRFTPPGRARYVASTVNRGESETIARISVDIFASAAATMLFVGTAAVSMSVSAEATGVNTGSVHSGTAAVSVGITSTASANITRSGVASIDVGITSNCTGALATQTYYGTASIDVGITATATGTSSTTHTGTADIQVNIDIVATGLTNNQIPDETVNGNHMTLYGNPSLTSDAVIGTRAVVFDGSDDYGLINDNFQSTFQSPFSISMWVKPDDGIASPTAGNDSAGDYLFSTYDGDLTESFYYVSRLANGKLHWHAYKDGSNRRTFQTDSAVFSDDSQSDYTHIVVTVSSTAVPLIYINGSSVNYSTGTYDTGSVNISTYNGTANTYIAQQGNGTLRFTGKIDDVSIWSTQLSSTEVSNLYNSGSGTSLTGSSNLAGWWKMGEGSTATIIHTGTATISASITASATGASVTGFSNTSVVEMDGTDDYMTTTFDTLGLASTGFSVSVWVKPSSSNVETTGTIYGRYNGSGSDRFALQLESTSLSKLSIHFGNSYSAFTHGMTMDAWNHICVVCEKATNWDAVIYVNGSSIGTKSVTTWTEHSSRVDTTVGSRRYSTFHLYEYTGLVDELAIYNTNIGTSDVASLYNSGNGPIDATTISDCVAYWRMGDGTEAGSGSTVYDMSTNSNDGTLVNAQFNTSDLP